jgi:hypothetical protein
MTKGGDDEILAEAASCSMYPKGKGPRERQTRGAANRS